MIETDKLDSSIIPLSHSGSWKDKFSVKVLFLYFVTQKKIGQITSLHNAIVHVSCVHIIHGGFLNMMDEVCTKNY